jgi:hypothetical protein
MKRIIALVALTIAFTACSPKLERAVNDVFNLAPLAVDEAERQGAITAELAGELRKDIPDGQQVTNDLIAELKQIPKDASDRRPRQLAAWQSAESKWLAIVNRGHFALNPTMQNFAGRANDLFATAIRIYGGVSAQGTNQTTPAPPNLTDDQIEKMLLERLENLANSLR